MPAVIRTGSRFGDCGEVIARNYGEEESIFYSILSAILAGDNDGVISDLRQGFLSHKLSSFAETRVRGNVE